MSIRLQVLLPEEEIAEIKRLAQRDQIPVGEWVRRALRGARAQMPSKPAEAKIQAIRRAAAHTFPTADIEQMTAEIERGYMEQASR